MQKSKLFIGIAIILTCVFLGLELFEQIYVAELVRALILPFLTLGYFFRYKNKHPHFLYFLVCYSASELFGGFGYLAYENETIDNIQYYLGNILYIIAYAFLIAYVFQFLEIKNIIKKFPIHVLIMLALDIYCVVLVSKISIYSGYMEFRIEYLIEIIYNSTVMLLLSVALLNFLLNDSNKAMLMLIGAVCILFSEVIQVADFYVKEMLVFKVIYNVLLIAAFVFFYIQLGFKQSVESKFKTLDKLEA